MILSPEELQVIRYQKTCFVVLGCCTVFPAGACTFTLDKLHSALYSWTFRCGYLFVLNDLCCTNKLHQGNKWSTVGSKNSTQAFDVWCPQRKRKKSSLSMSIHSSIILKVCISAMNAETEYQIKRKLKCCKALKANLTGALQMQAQC